MSNGRRGRRSSGSLLFLIIVLLATRNIWVPILGGLATVVGSFAVFAALIAFVAIVVSKSNKGSKYSQMNKTNRNPYSASSSNNKVVINGSEVIVNGKTVVEKEAPAPKPVEQPKEEPKHKTTGDPEIDKMIVDKDLAIEEMRRLNAAITDPKLSEQIDHLEQVTSKIVDYIIAHPKKKNQVGKFFSYYLPTTLKLLNAYDRMDNTGISGANVDGTKGKVADMMETALAAFDKQLDALFAEEALDVTTDIKVMENMLKSEGLTADDITLTL